MSGTIICGYDIETASPSALGFLEGAAMLHAELDLPWTIYLTGETLEKYSRDILPFLDDPRLTIGQHTYSHVLLKSVYMTPGDGKPIHDAFPNLFVRGGSNAQLRDEIIRTQAIFRDLLGLDCRGLTGPYGYYRGLSDRPDLLEILREAGIRWIRTDARDSRDCQPTPFSVQPHFYADQGFPEILEMGVQGFQDDFYWNRFDDRRHGETYQDYLYATLDEVARHNWVWNICSHDHGTPDAAAFAATKGVWLRDFLLQARSLGVRAISPAQLYGEMQRPGEEAGRPA